MKENSIQDATSSVKKAFLAAAGQVRESVKKPVDPEIAYYESLTPDDLKVISQKFGLDETERYVREMEARRRKVRR